MRRNLALSLTLLLMYAANAFAGAEARLVGKVLDGETKKPIQGVTVNVEAIEGKTVKQKTTTKADGSFAIFVLDGTIRYKFTFSAPEYQTVEETVKMKIGETTEKEMILYKGSAVAAAGVPGATAPLPPTDPGVVAYNEGAALANSGDYPGAIAKFEAAVAAKPDLLAGWSALAKVQLRQKNYPKAIEAAGKVLEIDDSDLDMIRVQHQAYSASGDKAKAAALEAKLPKNSGQLFNDAAKLINSGDDKGAEKLLKQAVEVDAGFAQAHYELGMIYVRSGNSAEARAALQKYLSISPDGKDAATAKEMLNYLK
jgi:TolA-binding protein